MKNADILRYVGTANFCSIRKVNAEFLRYAREIRDGLGNQSELFDEYLRCLLDAVSSVSVEDAAGICMRYAFDELRILCKQVRDGNAEAQSHPFYQRLKQAIEETPCPCDEVHADFYFSLLWAEYAEYTLSGYIEHVKTAVSDSMKDTSFTETETALRKLTGQHALDRLHILLYESHCIALYAQFAVQSFAEQDILSLLSSDAAGRYVFQYILEKT